MTLVDLQAYGQLEAEDRIMLKTLRIYAWEGSNDGGEEGRWNLGHRGEV